MQQNSPEAKISAGLMANPYVNILLLRLSGRLAEVLEVVALPNRFP